ncbi:hypothetical protein MA20_12825 [Bradyrhizobium japonicum]|uniref:Uncharacterized protein n=1 Tax=Bradyrhizobium japonicum TaxID=375 RepID=A0A0A3XY33_BRAJP|nr:hypothetical protein [Bradyrhizobium japonicum]KGT79300.1 hypothetical protein MA20_12825 [Bradyrhizobium japonicum]
MMVGPDEEEGLVHLSVGLAVAVDRFAGCFRSDGTSEDDLFGWAFWDRLYGPDCGVYYGLIDWTDWYLESEIMEEYARKLIKIMKDAGIQPGDIMIFTAIEEIWLRPDDSDREELMQGLQYAGDNGWVEDAGGRKLRLTAKGAAA